MGLSDWGKFIREASSSCFVDINLVNIKGYRVAFDGNLLMGSNVCKTYSLMIDKLSNPFVEKVDKEKMVRTSIKYTINKFFSILKAGVIPILVIDGERNILKSKHTLPKRIERQEKIKEKVKEVFESVPEDEWDNPGQENIKKLKTKLKQIYMMKADHMIETADALYKLGFPVIRSTSDGEKTCSSLCIENKIYAVISTDADTYAFGCPRLITKTGQFSKSQIGKDKMMCEMVYCQKALSRAGLDLKTTVDLFTMAGSDYNKGLHRVGVRTAYKKLLNIKTGEKKSIEDLGDTYNIDDKDFNYIQTRKQFKYEKSTKIGHPYIPKEYSVSEEASSTSQDPPENILEGEENILKENNILYDINKDLFNVNGEQILKKYEIGPFFNEYKSIIDITPPGKDYNNEKLDVIYSYSDEEVEELYFESDINDCEEDENLDIVEYFSKLSIEEINSMLNDNAGGS